MNKRFKRATLTVANHSKIGVVTLYTALRNLKKYLG